MLLKRWVREFRRVKIIDIDIVGGHGDRAAGLSLCWAACAICHDKKFVQCISFSL
jgi:hypothetical protein